MSMVEVDPELFIKCRLCLEDSGTYQIVPTVREQISYCVGIDVEPFDGLPQLVCKKCQSKVCEYSEFKKSLTEKQTALKKSQQNNLPEIENVGPAVKRQCTDVDKSQRNNSKRRKNSVSSTKSECNLESNYQVANKTSPLKVVSSNQDWTKGYNKTFMCKLCSIHSYTWKSAVCHKERHTVLKSKHAEVFNKNCVVVLHKLDNQSNITGSFDNVVYSKHKIIAKGTLDFNIAYIGNNGSDSLDEEDTKTNENCNLEESSDSSFRSSHAMVRHRRRRICSRSSNDTIVPENKSNASDDNVSDSKSRKIECIVCIDDTDSDDEKTKVEREQRRVTNNSTNATNATVIAKLVITYYNKFFRKYEKSEKPDFNQLYRKITSIGRQIINKRGFNSTRVIKYIKHLNLDIIWILKSPLNVTSSTNSYKIIARYSNEKNINNFGGYKLAYNKLIETTTTEEESLVQGTGTQEFGEVEASDEVETSGVVEESALLEEISAVDTSENQDHHRYHEIEPMASSCANERSAINHTPELKASVLYSNAAVDTRKLLNANPVANPRQLKKFTMDSRKDKAKPAIDMPTLEIDSNELSAEVTSGDDNNIQMPIIKFTTSLAVPEATTPSTHNETSNNNSNSNCVISNSETPQQTAPRIKVKSVTELMSKETLNRMNESSAPVVTQSQQLTQNGGASFEVYGTPQVHNETPSINSVKNFHTPESRSADYVILDTVELPNTKTSSPFKYFGTLLQVHNLTLVYTDVILTGDFHTLIRFKVRFKQETNQQLVILCSSLFCAKNVFCLKIKDRNEDNINMTKLTANWEWEILKMYRGQVIAEKLLNNAQKISQEVYDNTNSFLCLLKSINMVPK